MIDKATVQRIKDTADIVDIVGDYVHLIRRGANYMGLCPFHNERTPSFSVNKSRNFCYCFSCHKGGSPVNFIMEKEGMSYHDALLHLANRYGIKVEERELTDAEREAQTERESMLLANEWAMRKMEEDLVSTDEGRDVGLQYFYSRGLTDEAIKKFHLGYALDQPAALTSAAKKAGYDIEVMKTLGLTGTSQQGREYDRFRGRVIYPVMNSAGKVIAFGGRDLKGGLAKYINSPESRLYKKSNELYGIFQARSAIVSENRCFLVEGYMDVIGMWQAGMQNVVASSGTALTDGQINLIRRFTPNVTLIYDGDNAGIKAALRGIDMLLAHDMEVNVLLLPDGHDPDSFAKANTPEEFREYVEKHQTDIVRFKTEVLSRDTGNDPQKRVEVIRSVVETLANINDRIKLDVYVQTCGRILDISSDTIMQSVIEARKGVIERRRKNESYQQQEAAQIEKKDETPSDTPAQSTPPTTPQVEQTRQGNRPKEKSPFLELEKKVIEYCLRYGFINFCSETTPEGETVDLNVLDYFTEELTFDNIEFTVEIFGRIFNLLHELKDDFRVGLDSKMLDIDSEIEKMRSEGITRIASSGMSLKEIQREENKLEEAINEFRQKEILEFTKDFPCRELASHEDDKVRKTVVELLKDKHQLSAIYTRDQHTENEEDRLDTLLPRVMTEWRSEILNQKLTAQLSRFKEICGKGDPQEEERLMEEITGLMKTRAKVAKIIGERIISPRRDRQR